MKGACFVGIPYDRFICYLGLKEMSEFVLWREPKSWVMGWFDFFSFSDTEPNLFNELPNSQNGCWNQKEKNLDLNWLEAALADGYISVTQCPRQLSIYPSLHTMDIHRPKAMTKADGWVNTSDRSRNLHCRSGKSVPVEEVPQMEAIINKCRHITCRLPLSNHCKISEHLPL